MKLTKFFSLLGLLSTLAVSAQAADPNKVIRAYFRAPEAGFDPAKYSDHYSGSVMSGIFETLYDYDYLARPMTLVPKLAEGMPVVNAEGTQYTIKIKKGIFFDDDVAFAGKKREVTAQDFVYSLQRMVDPGNRGAPWDFMFKGKLLGLDEKIEIAQKTLKFPYDTPFEGIKALDRYTLQLNLKRPDFLMTMVLASPYNGVLAREVVEKYGDDIDAHPVGTGPYRLKLWERRNRIVLEASPTYRGYQYTPVAGAKGVDAKAWAEIKGKTLPIAGIVDIRVIESPQSAWLAMEDGGLDVMVELGPNFANSVAPGGKLAEKYRQRGYQHYDVLSQTTQWSMFNMDDPVVGGYTPEKIALRRAYALAFDSAWNNWVVSMGRVQQAQSPISPNIVGYDPAFRNSMLAYNPRRANAMLDVFGYKDCNNDGWREAPGCKPLKINYLYSTGKDTRDHEEQVIGTWRTLKIKADVKKVQFPDLINSRQNGTYQQIYGVWNADYPDAENFMGLLYGKNAGPTNESRFRNKDFDKLFEEISVMPDSAERNQKLQKMNRIVATYVPWMVEFHRVDTNLAQPWMRGYRPHPNTMPYFMFWDVDMDARAKALGKQPK